MFRDTVLKDPAYMEMITSDLYTHRTYYMGLVDDRRSLSFYDGRVRVVDPEGKEYATFQARDYRNYIAERAEPWTYMKFPYLKPVGWRGFTEGPESGVYAVAPMARLNVADGMSTPEAQKAYEELFGTLGRKPVHHTLANHWARVVEMVYAAERIGELSRDPEITSADLRVIPAGTPSVGYGVVEAPRGTLFHHYESDEQGLIRKANLVVATQNNAARIAMSVEKAAKGLVHKGQVSEGLLNRIEMAFRAYDPCHGCATHSLPGQMPLVARIHDADGRLVRELRR
jgi:F420-non-reducing hydrogenase large subunit